MSQNSHSTILAPSYKPPKAKSFVNMTEFDKIMLYISTLPPKDLSIGPIPSTKLSTQVFGSDRPIMRSNTEPTRKSESNIISLFGGSISVPVETNNSSVTPLKSFTNISIQKQELKETQKRDIYSKSEQVTSSDRVNKLIDKQEDFHNSRPEMTTLRNYSNVLNSPYNEQSLHENLMRNNRNQLETNKSHSASFISEIDKPSALLPLKKAIVQEKEYKDSDTSTHSTKKPELVNNTLSVKHSIDELNKLPSSRQSLSKLLDEKGSGNSKSNLKNNFNEKIVLKPMQANMSGDNYALSSSSKQLNTSVSKLPSTDPSTKSVSQTSSTNVPKESPTISFEEFRGIGSYSRNVGASQSGFDQFQMKLKSSNLVVLSLIWSDLTSNHATTSSKYCTPSSICRIWHCTCDKNIRVQQAYKPVIGIAVMFPDESEVAYFIPLSTCLGPGDSSRASQQSFILPLVCEVSLSQRWSVIASLLRNELCCKIIFNAAVFMLPVIKNLSTLLPELYSNIVISNVFDPKLAQYLVQVSSSDSDLDLHSILAAHNIKSNIPSKPEGLGNVSLCVQKLINEMTSLLELNKLLQSSLANADVISVFKDIEMPLSILLSKMEINGLRVSTDELKRIELSTKAKLEEVISTAHREATYKFNLASPDQVSDLLFNKLKLPPPTNSNKRGNYSTSEEDLLRIRDLKPEIIDSILAYRKLSKVISNNVEGLQSFLVDHSNHSSTIELYSNTKNHSPNNCRVHAVWNQTVVRTDISGLHINVRSVFIASRGCVLISADYSQIEMRVMAHVSGDNELAQLFNQEGDIYRQLAGRIFNKSASTITDQERKKAKTICLGVMYGMGAPSTAAKLGIEVGEAARIISAFFDRFKRVNDWMKQTKEFAKTNGYVKTLSGRRRYIPEIKSSVAYQAAQGERQAVNTVIQGTASDLIKQSMLIVENRLNSEWLQETRPRILLQIHDELIYEMKVSEAESGDLKAAMRNHSVRAFIDLLKTSMETSSGWKVPTPTVMQIGHSWGQMIAFDWTEAADKTTSQNIVFMGSETSSRNNMPEKRGFSNYCEVVSNDMSTELASKKQRRSID